MRSCFSNLSKTTLLNYDNFDDLIESLDNIYIVKSLESPSEIHVRVSDDEDELHSSSIVRFNAFPNIIIAPKVSENLLMANLSCFMKSDEIENRELIFKEFEIKLNELGFNGKNLRSYKNTGWIIYFEDFHLLFRFYVLYDEYQKYFKSL